MSARLPSDFPLGTLAVNLTGSFALGVLVGASVTHRVLFVLRHRVHGRLHDILDVDGRERAARRGRRGRSCCLRNLWLSMLSRIGVRRGRFLPGAGDRVISAGLKLDVYFGESLTSGRRMANEVADGVLCPQRLEVAALYRGIEGFGIGRRIHTERFPDISVDLPLIAEAIDTRERIESVLPEVHAIVDKGLVTIEHSLSGRRRGVRARPSSLRAPGPLAGSPSTAAAAIGAGAAPAYRAVVDLLRRQGARGATVLLGVDGIHNGQRWRAGLLSRNVNVPVATIAVGPTHVLRRVLQALPRRTRSAGRQPGTDRRCEARRRPSRTAAADL